MGYSTDHCHMYIQTLVLLLWLSAQPEKTINLQLSLIKTKFISSDKVNHQKFINKQKHSLILPGVNNVSLCNVHNKNCVMSITASFYLKLKI